MSAKSVDISDRIELSSVNGDLHEKIERLTSTTSPATSTTKREASSVAVEDHDRDDLSNDGLGSVATAREEMPPDMAIAPTFSGPPYSIYSKRQKRFIVFMAAFGGLFSPISGTIYFPALNPLAKDLHVSNSLINLTLTSYMIFQGLAPTLVGDLADTAGRRPAYAVCFVIYIGANIGLALQDSYAALFVLRCLQSTGSSATVALASGVVGDISTAAERGSFQGMATAGSQLGPVLGPVIGGILAEFLGWRAIFWFLIILAAVFLVPFVFVFPETSRNVVGDGSIPPQSWNTTLMSWLKLRRLRKERENNPSTNRPSLYSIPSSASVRPPRPKLRFPNPLSSIYLLLHPPTALLLTYNGLLFCGFYFVLATIPPQYASIYSFNTLQIGLCYIPFGFGCASAAYLNGRMLDWNFRMTSKRLGVKVDRKRQSDLSNFPIEQARLGVALWTLYCTLALLLIYGWVLDIRAPLAAPLVLLPFLGYSIMSTFNSAQTLLVDFHPKSPSTATAANNLLRCLLGAGSLALLDPIISVMGVGGCYSFLVGILLIFSPAWWVLYFKGMEMRNRDLSRKEDRKAQKEQEKKDHSLGEEGESAKDAEAEDSSREKVPMAVGGLMEAEGLRQVEKEVQEDQATKHRKETEI